MSPQSDAAASALRDNSNRPRSQNESPNSSPVPRSPSSTPDHRTRKMTKLVSKPPLANGAQPIHPAVAQLRRLVDGRSRRNSLPSNFANSSLRRVRSPASSTIIGHTREGYILNFYIKDFCCSILYSDGVANYRTLESRFNSHLSP